MSYSKVIKHKEVLVDREAGTAEITVTLKNRYAADPITTIGIRQLVEIGLEGGAEVLKILSGGGSLHNAYGEATRTWVVKIPSLEPENSTAAVLKRRKNAKDKEATKNSKNEGE